MVVISAAAAAERQGIRKAAVIGAGTMGAGIAAQFANAGIPVVLLDVVAPSEERRSALAIAGVERQKKVGGFMHPAAVDRVTVGNTADDLSLIADVDWIVEAVREDLEVKTALYRRVEAVRKASAIVSSNTSTIPLERLVAGLGPGFAGHFAITHFFNPPRAMQLVELVAGDATDPAVAARLAATLTTSLGKTVVTARDTPGFIANRIGCAWMAIAYRSAEAHGISFEDADKTLAAVFGLPRTGVFGLFDLIGIGLVPPVYDSLERALPPSDVINRLHISDDPLIRGMIERGLTGRGGSGGFYRVAVDRSREVLDPGTWQYRPETPLDPAALAGRQDLRTYLAGEGPHARFAFDVMARTIAYAAEVAPDIADDVRAVDDAMRLGFNWPEGPFALADRVGPQWLSGRMTEMGMTVPTLLRRAAAGGFYGPRGDTYLSTGGIRVARPPDRLVSLRAVRDRGAPVFSNDGASLLDLGSGICCLEFHRKMNALDVTVFDAIEAATAIAAADFRGMVIGNEAPRAFSAGADVAFFLDAVRRGDRAGVEAFITRGQALFSRLKYAAFPVVGAAFGMALGGGCEVLLHCDAIVAHADLNAGLPESKIGIVPGWGGCAQMLIRYGADSVAGAFAMILAGTVSTSAELARDMKVLRPDDPVVMNRAHLITEAKAMAVALADTGYTPPPRVAIATGGDAGRRALLAGLSGETADRAGPVADALATILSGGGLLSATEDEIMALEKAALVELAFQPAARGAMERLLGR